MRVCFFVTAFLSLGLMFWPYMIRPASTNTNMMTIGF